MGTTYCEGLKDDPNGPQLDLREELIKHLGQRVSMVTDYELPITTSSERLLFAIETTDDEAVAKALEKVVWKRSDRQETRNRRACDLGDRRKRGAGDGRAGGIAGRRARPGRPNRKKANQQRLMPHAAATVVDGHLFVASHMDFLLKVLRSKDPLTKDVDYQLVSETINQMNPQDKCARVFSRTDEEYRPTYELIKQNKMPESESMLGQLLNMLFGESKKGAVRHQKIDGSKLPEYEVVRHYLGPAGMQVTAEKDGWFLKGFTLNKEDVERRANRKDIAIASAANRSGIKTVSRKRKNSLPRKHRPKQKRPPIRPQRPSHRLQRIRKRNWNRKQGRIAGEASGGQYG